MPTECTVEDSYFFFDTDSSSESDSDSEETGSEDSESEETGSEDSVSEETGSEDSESVENVDKKKGKGQHSKDTGDESHESTEEEFNAEWVTASPSASATSFPTSVNSSYINVKYVCGTAPTASPTIAPTVNDLIMFDAQQVIISLHW